MLADAVCQPWELLTKGEFDFSDELAWHLKSWEGFVELTENDHPAMRLQGALYLGILYHPDNLDRIAGRLAQMMDDKEPEGFEVFDPRIVAA